MPTCSSSTCTGWWQKNFPAWKWSFVRTYLIILLRRLLCRCSSSGSQSRRSPLWSKRKRPYVCVQSRHKGSRRGNDRPCVISVSPNSCFTFRAEAFFPPQTSTPLLSGWMCARTRRKPPRTRSFFSRWCGQAFLSAEKPSRILFPPHLA